MNDKPDQTNPDALIPIYNNSPKEDVARELKNISGLIGVLVTEYDKLKLPPVVNVFVSKNDAVNMGIDQLPKPKDPNAQLFHEIGTAALKASVPHISEDLKKAQTKFANDACKAAGSKNEDELNNYRWEAINANEVVGATLSAVFQVDKEGNFLKDKNGNYLMKDNILSTLTKSINDDPAAFQGIKDVFPDFAAHLEEQMVLKVATKGNVNPSIDEATKLLQRLPVDAVRDAAEAELRVDLTPRNNSAQQNTKGR